MKRLTVEWNFLSYWHISSGESFGSTLDLVTRKDELGFPVLPGKTIKGLFREAFHLMVDAGHIEQEKVNDIFGTADNLTLEEETTGNTGLAVFESAKIDQSIAAELVQLLQKTDAFQREVVRQAWVEHFYRQISSTAIDSNTGIARPHTLRRIEVAIPMRLYSFILSPNEAEADFRQAAKLLRHVGLGRRRGLGRVHTKIVEVQDA
ncbi:MAG: hypothetical protein D6767_10905 [Candidatus Hydrogenedentota bacterium]|nr:MAG: hypothetical protein D6767_10905 [Candidatus Hydrogenedentota bacterium]